MIRLIVAPYCNSCGEFEVDISKTELSFCGGVSRYDTTIGCTHKDRCECLRKYIEAEKEETR